MTKSVLAIAAVVSVLTVGSALAQQNPYTKAPPPTPVSAAHQQALLDANPDPDACIKAVEKAADNVGFRIQGDDGKNTRMYMHAMYEAARSAARTGDNDACWKYYDRAMNRP